MTERLLKRALELRTCAPETARLGAAMAHGDLSPDDIRWVYLAANLVEAVIEDLEQGTLRSSDDLPQEPPLFTTRQLFKAFEVRVKRLEDAAADDSPSGRWPRGERMPTCIEGVTRGEWYHRQCVEEYWAAHGGSVIEPRTVADLNHYISWWNQRAATLSSGAPAADTPTPHDAAPWSVWGIGDTWWVHHSASGMFLPIVRGGEMLTPTELVEAGARPLGGGGVVDG